MGLPLHLFGCQCTGFLLNHEIFCFEPILILLRFLYDLIVNPERDCFTCNTNLLCSVDVSPLSAQHIFRPLILTELTILNVKIKIEKKKFWKKLKKKKKKKKKS